MFNKKNKIMNESVKECEIEWDKIVQEMKGAAKNKMKNMSIRDMYHSGVGYSAIIEAEKKEQDSGRLGRILGCVHLLMSEAIHLIDEGESMMPNSLKNKFGFGHNIKMLNKYFNQYCRAMDSLISKEDMKKFRSDFEDFDMNIRHWANLTGWKESTDETVIEGTIERIKNLHSEICRLSKEYAEKKSNGNKEKYAETIKSLMEELRMQSNEMG